MQLSKLYNIQIYSCYFAAQCQIDAFCFINIVLLHVLSIYTLFIVEQPLIEGFHNTEINCMIKYTTGH